MFKFLYKPEQSSYAITYGNSVVAVQMDGGPSKFRSDIKNAPDIVNVSWAFSSYEYDYFKTFLSAVEDGATPFLIDLIIEEAGLVEHEVHFVPKTAKLKEQKGLSYYVTAKLEVNKIPRDKEFDFGYIDMLSAYGDEQSAFDAINQLDIFVNTQIVPHL